MSGRHVSPTRRRYRLLAAVAAAALALPASAAVTTTAAAAAAAFASFTDGGVIVDGVRFVKPGDTITLTVNAANKTQCVQVSGAHSLIETSDSAKTTWVMSFSAVGTDGDRSVSVSAWSNFNKQGCNGSAQGSGQASYRIDTAAPTVTGAVTPAANALGWHREDVSVTWSATDGAGSGVVNGPTPRQQTWTAETGGTTLRSTATDAVGITGTGEVFVKLDKTPPTISAARNPEANRHGWNKSAVTVTAKCTDDLSGVASCSGSATLDKEGENQHFDARGVDNAGNVNTAGVGGINIDLTPPTLAGSAPEGWQKDDVKVTWTCSDALSGIDGGCPEPSSVTGEGANLSATASVDDRAGNKTTTTVEGIQIDRTSPTTNATAPDGWRNTAQRVELSANDALSGVAFTQYRLDGGEVRTGTSVEIHTNGVHTLEYWSTDNAGNVEVAKKVQVQIDGTSPSISSSQDPGKNANGWNNTDVTVSFICTDALSGIESCTEQQIIAAEGVHQVTGTATDNAGNTATATHPVSIDKTAPSIAGSADRRANDNGWYSADVTVAFTCDDDLSGLKRCTGPTTIGEGADQRVDGKATDAADNHSTASVTGINVDKTAPRLTGNAASGWHSGDVTVTWECSDNLSGIDGDCPADAVVTGEGDNLSASATIRDKAGNETNTTVAGIQIDRTAPHTSATHPSVPKSGWFTAPVEVVLSGIDAMSGVARTSYRVDGGDEATYDGPITVSNDGTHTVTYWSVDNAGNVEAAETLTLKVDQTPPTTTMTVLGEDPRDGWYVKDLIVSFSASDGVDSSGVAKTWYTVNGSEAHEYGDGYQPETSGIYEITYWSVDHAGNVEGVRHHTVKFDKVPPTITGTATPAANDHGWNNTDVTVEFQCADDFSATPSCSDPVTLENEGADQSVPGETVDEAGNRASITVGPINIDKTAPTLVGATTTQPNAAGWYRGDVTVVWTGEDALSGIDEATQPAATVITGEGENLKAGPVSISDKAGNPTSAGLSGVSIDRTAPTITGAATTKPNGEGWYNGPVTVRFDCKDNLSGAPNCSNDKVLSEDGGDQSVTSDAPVDLAGNVGKPATVDGINIDSTAPVTTSEVTCEKVNNWCTAKTVPVELIAIDPLSGVKEIRYTIGTGEEQSIEGASATFNLPTNGEGHAVFSYYAVDRAGNAETPQTVTVNYDNIAPVVTHTLDPEANAHGWNNTDVTVKFDATDNGSKVDDASVSPEVTVTEEGQHTITGTARDRAGNTGTAAAKVNIDKTAPTITATAHGTKVGDWYTGPVTVKFACADAMSGVQTCPSDDVLTENGPDQSATGTVTDKAGNTASVTVEGIKIDAAKPNIVRTSLQDGAKYVLGDVPAATCTATDEHSGVSSCDVKVTGGLANGVGSYTYTATATDKAGNSTTITGAYKVIYRFDGFLQPINDTAHQVGVSTSVFKAGSTVPVKFELKNIKGQTVQANTAPVWPTPVKGSAMTGPVDETAYSVPADSGTTYRGSDGQYMYNWKTDKSSGNYWRIGVRLDDGEAYYVNIGAK
jgi:hypothetical protein